MTKWQIQKVNDQGSRALFESDNKELIEWLAGELKQEAGNVEQVLIVCREEANQQEPSMSFIKDIPEGFTFTLPSTPSGIIYTTGTIATTAGTYAGIERSSYPAISAKVPSTDGAITKEMMDEFMRWQAEQEAKARRDAESKPASKEAFWRRLVKK